jgi:hypothetical protein
MRLGFEVDYLKSPDDRRVTAMPTCLVILVAFTLAYEDLNKKLWWESGTLM